MDISGAGDFKKEEGARIKMAPHPSNYFHGFHTQTGEGEIVGIRGTVHAEMNHTMVWVRWDDTGEIDGVHDHYLKGVS